MIIIDWFNQSIKIDTHSPNGLNCYWLLLNTKHERKFIIMLHIVFLLALFSLFLDFSMVHYITVLLHSLIYQASVLSAVECLVYATLKAHDIFLLIVILLSSLSVAQVNVPDVCFFCYIKAAYKLFVLVTL